MAPNSNQRRARRLSSAPVTGVCQIALALGGTGSSRPCVIRLASSATTEDRATHVRTDRQSRCANRPKRIGPGSGHRGPAPTGPKCRENTYAWIARRRAVQRIRVASEGRGTFQVHRDGLKAGRGIRGAAPPDSEKSETALGGGSDLDSNWAKIARSESRVDGGLVAIGGRRHDVPGRSRRVTGGGTTAPMRPSRFGIRDLSATT